MKKIRILALILAVVVMCVSIPSCAEVVTKTNVRFSAIIDVPTDEKDEDGNTIFKEQLLVDTLQGDITGTTDDYPTVLDAVVQILEQNGVRHKVEDESTITSIDGKAETTRGGYFYVWEYVIKQKDPNNPDRYVELKGRANELFAEDDMQIVYHLVAAADKNLAAEPTPETAE